MQSTANNRMQIWVQHASELVMEINRNNITGYNWAHSSDQRKQNETKAENETKKNILRIQDKMILMDIQ